MDTMGHYVHENHYQVCSLPKQKIKSRKLSKCSLNFQGLASEERLTDLDNALDKINHHIIGPSEIKRKGESLKKKKVTKIETDVNGGISE